MEMALSVDHKDLEAQVSVPRVHSWVISTIQLLRSFIVAVGSLYVKTWLVDETIDPKVPAKSWFVNEMRQQRMDKPRKRLNVADIENMYRLNESGSHGNIFCNGVVYEDEVRDRKIHVERQKSRPVWKPAQEHFHRIEIPTEGPKTEERQSNVRNLPRFARKVDQSHPKAFERQAEQGRSRQAEQGRSRQARMDNPPTPQQVKEKKRWQAKGLRKRMGLQDRDLRQFAIRNAWRMRRLDRCH